MRGERKHIETDNQIILLLFLLSLLVRIPLISWYSAEYTDAIFQMTLLSNQSTFWPPLYALMIKLLNYFFHDPELSGRFVSILAGSLCVYPIYLIGRFLFNYKTGIYASILYIFSPVALRWNLRVEASSLFTLFFLAGLFSLLKFWINPERKWIFLSFFLAGLASSTRYEGLALLPLIGLLGIREIKEKRYKSVLFSLWGIVPWLLLGWWWNYRGFGQMAQYQERIAPTFISSLFMYWTEVECYILSLPYVLTYPIFGFFCYGTYKARSLPQGKLLLQIFFYLLLLWLITHSTIRSFQTRYFLPLIPLFLILAGYGISQVKKERLAFVACLTISIIFSGAVLFFQRDSFGDIKRAALWVRDNVKGDIVFSDEFYKTQFWSGKRVRLLSDKPLREGDYLILHSLYSPLSEKINYFQKKYELKVAYGTTSSIVPLLPDLLNRPAFTNSPGWLTVKYQRQTFDSVVVKVLKEKE